MASALVAVAATARDTVPIASGVAVALVAPAIVADVRSRRIPDRTLLTATLVAAAVAAVTTLVTGTGTPVTGAVAGLAALAGPILVLHLLSPGSMGFGDVKAAAVLGAAVGLVDWQLALGALAIAAGATAAVAIAVGRSTMPFAPGLTGAAALVLAVPGIVR